VTTILHAGVDTRLAGQIVAAGSVDAAICSPPFLALRDYGTGDDREIGHEPSPADFLDALLDLTDMWGRLLAPHGSIAVELGDTYSGSGGAGGDYAPGGLRDGQPTFKQGRPPGARTRRVGRTDRRQADGWPAAKSLCGIPTLYAWSLAYGRNLLRPERTCDRWLVRNVIAWGRSNPPVGDLGDKVRPATSYITVATRSRARWFDLEAVRAAGPGPNTHTRVPRSAGARANSGKSAAAGRGGGWSTLAVANTTTGATPLDYWLDDDDAGTMLWDVATQPSSIDHHAMWPPSLADRLVRMLVPLEVCTTCGEPRRRLVDSVRCLDGEPADLPPISTTERAGADGDGIGHWRKTTKRTTVGWSDCGHGTWRPGVVLDPFAGAGTTLAVAELAGRDAIGIDLNPNLHDLYPRRLAEVRRKLYKAPAVAAGQLGMFTEGETA